MFVFAPLVTFLIEVYGWRGALLLVAGIFSQSLICASFLKPLPIYKSVLPPIITTTETDKICNATDPAEYLVCKKEDLHTGIKLKTVSTDFTEVHGEQECEYHAVSPSKPLVVKTYSKEGNFLTGSVISINQLCLSNVGSLQSISVLSKNSHQSTFTQQINSICYTLHSSLIGLFDFKLFGNTYVILFTVVNMFMAASHFGGFTFTPRRCEAEGIGQYKSSLVLSMVGLGDVIGRIGFGIVGMKVDNTFLYTVAAAWTSVFFLVSSFATEFGYILMWSFSFSIGLGK